MNFNCFRASPHGGAEDPYCIHQIAICKQDNYCGQELTVQEVYRMDKMLRVYVYENGFYWLPEFCDCVVERYLDIEPVSQNELLNLLFV